MLLNKTSTLFAKELSSIVCKMGSCIDSSEQTQRMGISFHFTLLKDTKTRKQIINGCHIRLAGNHEGRNRTLCKDCAKVFLARIIKGCEKLGKLFVMPFKLLSAFRVFSV